MHSEFNMKNYANNLCESYFSYIFSQVFLIKAVSIYVTYYMKHILGYGVFTTKAIKKRRISLELSRRANRWGGSSGTGETIRSRGERKLFVLLHAK